MLDLRSVSANGCTKWGRWVRHEEEMSVPGETVRHEEGDGKVKPPIDGFWGKLDGGRGQPVSAWHPLEHHCIDVACVTESLLEKSLLGRRLATLAGRECLDEVTRARLCVLAGLHDIGKANAGFQRKAYSERDTAGHVREGLAFLLEPDNQRRVLEPLMSWGEGGFGLLQAVISHHGRAEPESVYRPRLWSTDHGRDPIAVLCGLRDDLLGLFPRATDDGPELPVQPAFGHGLAGLVMLADWLGSDTRFFPFTQERGTDRGTFARAAAAHALDAIGIDPGPFRQTLGSDRPTFASIAPDPSWTARPMQQAVQALEPREGADLVVLESETGSGKTEAALIHFLRAFAAGQVDGLYFALPTRTAATQLHRRVVDMCKRAFGEQCPAIVLAVPGYLQFDDVRGRSMGHFDVEWSELPSADALWDDRPHALEQERGWAAERPKRFLAGAIAVGTIDQVLLGVLQVKHAHLRGAALLRHMLVIDEVHASDAYMTKLTEQVLRHHFAAGGQAFLMSATLGAEARSRFQRLLDKDATCPPFESARALSYPLITRSCRSASEHEAVEEEAAAKTVEWSLSTLADEPTAVVTIAVDAARNGARVLMIRNTVGDAVATQRTLEAMAPELAFRCVGVPAPHHSRFAKDDREALDEALEAQIGKQAPPEGGVVVVATQTVQQSLDLDADLMITDLCPVDVLLQRIGRLHRHADRARPSGFKAARCVVLVPEGSLADFIIPTGDARGPHGLGTVYSDLRILQATRELIAAQPSIRIPEHARSLVEQATHPEALAAVVESASDDRWNAHAQSCRAALLVDGRMASLNLVNWEDVPYAGLRFPDERRVPTRLGLDDRVVRVHPMSDGPFGTPVRELKLAGHIAQRMSLPDDAVTEDLEVEPGGFTFRLDDTRFRYGRCGLEVIEDD